MPSLTRQENPLWPWMLTRASAEGMTNKARRIAEVARSNTRHPSIASSIQYEEAKATADGYVAEVKVTSRVGAIFEKGALNRRLLGRGLYPRGTYRGSIQPEHYMEKAIEQEKNIPPEIRF